MVEISSGREPLSAPGKAPTEQSCGHPAGTILLAKQKAVGGVGISTGQHVGILTRKMWGLVEDCAGS